MEGQMMTVQVPEGIVGGQMMIVNAGGAPPPPPQMNPMQPQMPPQMQMQAAPQAMQASAGTAPDLYTTFDPTGKYSVIEQGAFAAAQGLMVPGDGIKSEGGAMISMSPNVIIKTSMDGGCGQACCRCCCLGESFFLSTYDVEAGQGDVLLGPPIPGDVMVLHMDGQQSYKIQKGSFLACDKSIEIKYALQGCCQGLASGEGFIIQEAFGVGRLVLNSYGSIARYDLQPGEVRVVDNGALVAWSGFMQYNIGLASQEGGFMGRLFNSFATGEALVCRFTGPGTVYVQTRSLFATAHRLFPLLPEHKKPKPQSNN